MNDFRDADQTRNRVLKQAVEIFAQRGFRETTIREICAQAGVNTASVNYHFRNKSSLYKEALAFAFQQADMRYPLDEANDASLPADMRLAGFIRMFLHKLTDETNLGHHGKLIAREIADPTDALDEIISKAIFPQFKILKNIVDELIGKDWSEQDRYRFVLGILGQCLMYKHSRSVIDRICPEVIASPEEINNTAGHIVRFSLAAFQRLSET